MAHPDVDALLDESLTTAVYFLEKNGEFFPFAITMSSSGCPLYSDVPTRRFFAAKSASITSSNVNTHGAPSCLGYSSTVNFPDSRFTSAHCSPLIIIAATSSSRSGGLHKSILM